MKTMKKTVACVLALMMSILGLLPAAAQAEIDPVMVRSAASASGLKPLADIGSPTVKELKDFLNPGASARMAAIQLGKALFWDMQAGSDGQACASCHFHAGADSRARNQLSPDLKNVNPALQGLFNPTASGNIGPSGVSGGPDYTLVEDDFPFHQLDDAENNNFSTRTVTFDTDDVASSMGAFAENFTAIGAPLLDAGLTFVDLIFNLGNPSATLIADNVRRVEPRNTPTVINAVFNHSNFWDGRAHNLFNGVSVIGPLDPGAMIWVADKEGNVSQAKVSITNSSLASQSVGPPTSDLEMSFFNRPFPLIGRKLLALTPLDQQLVAADDSVLGPLSKYPAHGLSTTYPDLIKAAFRSAYWNGAGVSLDLPGSAFDGTYTQMEANFTLFWGLAIQIYEATLVSDDAPFDRFMSGDDTALSQEQLQGLLVFLNRGARGNLPPVANAIQQAGVEIGAGNCISCHGSSLFTDAAFPSLREGSELELIEIEDTLTLDAGFLALDTTVQGLLDNGFANIGVRPNNNDLGRGGMEGGFPLSFTRQMLDPDLNFLLDEVVDDFPCTPGLDCPARIQVDGAFKIPTLRNVELTGPYFHNGGQATLEQAVEFYDRQSDFGDANINELDRNMVFINMDDPDEEPLVEFLLSLTDDRVRNEMAPFDHPQLFVPNGGAFVGESVLEIPAVGANGGEGLSTFLGLEHTD